MVTNKKGLSAVVGYVLLISITVSLSALVYTWLTAYVSSDEVEECSENVNIVISSYECYESRNGNPGRIGNLTITLKNKGLFTVDGYVLRFHDKENADFGIYTLNNEIGSVLAPGEEITLEYDFDDIADTPENFYTISLVDAQPFMEGEDGSIICQSYTVQEIDCVA